MVAVVTAAAAEATKDVERIPEDMISPQLLDLGSVRTLMLLLQPLGRDTSVESTAVGECGVLFRVIRIRIQSTTGSLWIQTSAPIWTSLPPRPRLMQLELLSPLSWKNREGHLETTL